MSQQEKEKEAPVQESPLTDMVEKYAESAGPLATQIGFGSVAGYATGVALKAAGKVAAVGVGSAFILVQGLAYIGYIEVDWRKVERDYASLLDLDGDGKVTAGDLNLAWEKVNSVLAFNMPAGTGFSAGLLYGMGVSPLAAGGAGMAYGVGARALLGGAAVTSVPAGVLALSPVQKARQMLGMESLPPIETEAEKYDNFCGSLQGMDIQELRSVEASLKGQIGNVEGAELDALKSHLDAVEKQKCNFKETHQIPFSPKLFFRGRR